jgi:hypothetical protein
MLHRLAKTGAAAARGRYAALQPVQEAPEASEPGIAAADPYAAATVHKATTLEWLMNMWDGVVTLTSSTQHRAERRHSGPIMLPVGHVS